MKTKSNTIRKLTSSVVAVVVLAACLLVTSAALVITVARQENNVFQTARMKINLNNGNPIISEHEFLFEPGATIKKDFFVRNESTIDVYYRIYFDIVGSALENGLADVLEITIQDGTRVLYHGTPSGLNREAVAAADDQLTPGEQRNLTMYFHFPENVGNTAQNASLTFNLCADATQVRNNELKKFG